MLIKSLPLAGLILITHKVFKDNRGLFIETYRRDHLAAKGIDVEFVQDNQSISLSAGTVRGLHYQSPPAAQDKLVRVISGSIRDVAVDLRRKSPTFGRHFAVTLRADTPQSFFVPKGFAHGFITLEPDTVVGYKVSVPYCPSYENGIFWNDPALAIDWGLSSAVAILSRKDLELPPLKEIETPF